MLKRILFLLAIISIVSSCASNQFDKRKYTPGKFKALKQKNIKTDKHQVTTDDLIDFDAIEQKEESNESSKEEIKKQAIQNTSDAEIVGEIQNFDLVEKQQPMVLELESYSTSSNQIKFKELRATPQDTVFIDAESEKGRIAQKAENKGLASLILGILAFFIPFGLIFAIVGLALANGSLSSPYNTENGRTLAKAGRITSSIAIILRILLLILIVALIFSFAL